MKQSYRYSLSLHNLTFEISFFFNNRVSDDPLASAVSLAREIATRSPDSVAAAKQLYQKTWYASEKDCLELETKLQKKLILSLNQVRADTRRCGYLNVFI